MEVKAISLIGKELELRSKEGVQRISGLEDGDVEKRKWVVLHTFKILSDACRAFVCMLVNQRNAAHRNSRHLAVSRVPDTSFRKQRTGGTIDVVAKVWAFEVMDRIRLQLALFRLGCTLFQRHSEVWWCSVFRPIEKQRSNRGEHPLLLC